MNIKLTRAQAEALRNALSQSLHSCDVDEQLSTFGGPQQVKAAERADEILRSALSTARTERMARWQGMVDTLQDVDGVKGKVKP